MSARRAQLAEDGFVPLPGFLPPEAIAPALAALAAEFPTVDEFHDGHDPARNEPLQGDPYAGQRDLPFARPELGLLLLHPLLVGLAEELLDSSDLRLYAGELWGKYAGAASYDQEHHRDNHSPLVPTDDVTLGQVELFILLSEVEQADGPPAFVSRTRTQHLPRERHAYPRDEHPELYEAEQLGVGPAGTVVAFRSDTVHRGTELTRERGARFTAHACFRRARDGWYSRHAMGDRSYHDGWTELVAGATYRQLLLLDFPPAGHPYWTADTIDRMAERYPGLDLRTWAAGIPPSTGD